MMGEKKLVPKRRFEGFTEEWRKQQLNSIFNRIRNGFVGTATPYYVNFGNFYLQSNNVKNGKINRETEVFINNEFYKKQEDKLLRTGDLVMVQSGHVGHTAVIPQELDKTAAHALIMFQGYKKEANPYFYNYQFQTIKVKKRLSSVTTGNTIRHILASDMGFFEMNVTSIKEQQKIGQFFKHLDEMIALQQRKIDKTKALKSAYLAEMFPAEEEHVPKRRFEGFMGDWKEIKLGEVAEFNPNSTLPDVFKYVDLESVIGTEIVSYRTEFKRSAPSRAQRLAVRGDIFYQTVRPYQKNNYLYDLPYNNFVFSTGYAQMRPDINGYFLLSQIQEEKFVMKVLNRCTGTGYPAINSNDLANIEIRVPNDRKEQQKIGQFFKHLDEMIATHQQKLEKLKATKQAYLHEMFV